MELSRATWLVATFAPRLGDKIGVHAIPGGNTERLLDLVGRLQAKLRAKGVCRVRTVCCYEAGCDGFWLRRVLVHHGVENHVLDAAKGAMGASGGLAAQVGRGLHRPAIRSDSQHFLSPMGVKCIASTRKGSYLGDTGPLRAISV